MNNRISIAPESVISRAPGLVSTEVDGETLLLSIERGYYYGLDASVGSRIWQLLEQPQSLRALCEALTGDFVVTPDECLSDVVEFLSALSEEGLVVVSSSNADLSGPSSA
jgi:hypothetical protein